MYQQRIGKTHAGWSAAEDNDLFAQTEAAQKNGVPLKRIFDAVAEQTGRQPNSVRNYYYARVKRDMDAASRHNPAFVSFTEAESEQLLVSVLTALSAGESVRACTMRLGGGDTRAMLRYQNKYRSLLKSNPDMVQRVLEQLRRNGVRCQDPYLEQPGRRKVGRPRKQPQDLGVAAAAVVAELSEVEGLDIGALLECLGTLAVSAINGARLQRQYGESSHTELVATLQAENDALRAQIAAMREQHAGQYEKFRSAVNCFKQLVRINTEFLSMNSIVKVSNLTSYLHDLENNVQSCQQVMLSLVN